MKIDINTNSNGLWATITTDTLKADCAVSSFTSKGGFKEHVSEKTLDNWIDSAFTVGRHNKNEMQFLSKIVEKLEKVERSTLIELLILDAKEHGLPINVNPVVFEGVIEEGREG